MYCYRTVKTGHDLNFKNRSPVEMYIKIILCCASLIFH